MPSVKSRLAFRIVGGVAIGLAILLAVALIVGPRLIELPSVKARIEGQVSALAHGSVSWESLEARILPSPRAVLRGGRIDIAGRVAGKVDEIHAQIALWPLLAGRVEVGAVSLVRPVLRIDVPAAAPQEPEPQERKPAADPRAAYLAAVRTIATVLRKYAPDVELGVEDAALELHVAAAPPIQLSHVDLTASGSRESISLDARAASNYWHEARVQARLGYAALDAEVDLSVTRGQPQPLLDLLLTEGPLQLSIPSADVRARARTDGRGTLQAALTATAPDTSVTLNSQRLPIGEVRFQAEATARADSTEIRLASLYTGDLLPDALATLRFAGTGRNPKLDVTVPVLELARVRDAVHTLFAEENWMRDFVAPVRSGRASDVQFSAEGESFATLFSPASLRASLVLADGATQLPWLDEEVNGISGRVVLTGTGVSASEVSGTMGKARVRGGWVSYDWRARQLGLDLGYELDIAHALGLAQQLVPAKHRAFLRQFQAPRGGAQGKIRMQAHGAEWSALVEVVQSDASLRLRALPFPLQLRSGWVSLMPGEIQVTDVAGAIGGSTVSEAGVALTLGAHPTLQGGSARVRVALPEVLAWLKRQDALQDPLQDLLGVRGAAEVTLHDLSGRLDRPQAFAFDASIAPVKVRIETSLLPAPLALTSGTARLTREHVLLDRLVVGMLDSRAAVSGRIDAYQTRDPVVDLSIADGVAGEQLVGWGLREIEFPERFDPKTPLHFSAERVRWRAKEGVNAQASVQYPAGQRIAADVGWRPDALDVRRLALKDSISDIVLSLQLSKSSIATGLAGTLTGASLSAILKDGRAIPGKVAGNLRIHFNPEQYVLTDSTGSLQAESIDLHGLGWPLRFDRFALEADGSRLLVPETVVDWKEQVANVRGAVRLAPDEIDIVALIRAGDIDAERLLPAAGDAQASAPPEPEQEPTAKPAAQASDDGPGLLGLKLTAQASLHADSIRYRRLNVTGLSAQLDLEPGRARFEISRGHLCGLSLPLMLDITPHVYAVTAGVHTKGAQLEDVVRCLSDQELQLTGDFDLDAELSSRGRLGELLRNLSGRVQFEARNGLVKKFALLGNILSLTDVVGLLDPQGRQLRADGFPYRKMVLDGRITEGKLRVREAAFDSSAVGIAANGSIDLVSYASDINVLVAPFGRIDRVVRKIPLIGYVVGGTLTSLPVKVSGDIRSPYVIPLGPGAVANELVGVFQRTLNLPAHLFGLSKPAETK